MKDKLIVVLVFLLINSGCSTSNENISRYPKTDIELCIAKNIGLSIDELLQDDTYNDIRCADLSAFDLRKYEDKLYTSIFSSMTKWPDSNKIPVNFSYEELIATAMKPPLGIKNIHNRGVTGKNITIAILDHFLLCEHEEYAQNIIGYDELNTENLPNEVLNAHFHGTAVASIAVGKNVGVAPDANVYFISDYLLLNSNDEKNRAEALTQNIYKVIEVNKTLPENEKIRAISYSNTINEDDEKLKNAIMEAKNQNIEIISASLFMTDFSGIRKLPYLNGDFVESYVPTNSSEKFYVDTKRRIVYEDFIAVPFQGIVYAGPSSKYDYVYSGAGGVSWGVPYLAGLYALCCEVDNDMNLEKFIRLADVTSVSSSFDYNGISYVFNKIIQPEIMISYLVNQKEY